MYSLHCCGKNLTPNPKSVFLGLSVRVKKGKKNFVFQKKKNQSSNIIVTHTHLTHSDTILYWRICSRKKKEKKDKNKFLLIRQLQKKIYK